MNVIGREIKAYTTTTFMYFDIETIPTQTDAVKADIVASLKAPKNYSKPETVEKWIAENKQDAIDKSSFDGGLGHVCTIAWTKNDGDIKGGHIKDIGDEAELISEFFSDFDPHHSETLCGQNIAGFDIPFLTKRAVVLGIQLPVKWPKNPAPWDKTIHDTMSMWGGREMVGMDRICKMLGIDGKDGLDGSQVAQSWAAGEHDKIKEYCEDDVRRTREIHKRFLAVGW